MCPVLLSCDIHGTRIWVSTVVDPKNNRPLESTRSIAVPLSYFLLKRKLTDQPMRKERTFGVVTFPHDSESLVADQLSQILTLTRELRAHFARVVHPCKEHKRRSSLRLISSPNRGHEPAVMLAQVVIEQEPGNVSGIHQVLHNR